MTFLMKGHWFDELHISTFSNGTAMARESFIKAFHDQYSSLKAPSKEDHGLQAAFARFYQVSNVAGEAVFCGQVIMFSTGHNIAEVSQPFFIKQVEALGSGRQDAAPKTWCTFDKLSQRNESSPALSPSPTAAPNPVVASTPAAASTSTAASAFSPPSTHASSASVMTILSVAWRD